jgi:hypothetical protein
MATSAESIVLSEDERIRHEILEARQRLNGLQRNLSDIETRLDGLGEQRTTYDLLEQACGTLERLEQLGADDLFWGQEGGRATGEHVQQVRERAEGVLAISRDVVEKVVWEVVPVLAETLIKEEIERLTSE